MSDVVNETDNRSALAEKLKWLPDRPGVYLMKNAAGEVIYVGKAVSLRNRVRSYFQSARGLSPKVRALVGHVADFEYIVTDTEVEALILECNLIKEKAPWYNVRLKDDKSYPFLKVTNEPFPRVMVVRRRQKDGGRYFGPYTNVTAMRETLKLLQKLFPVRTCSLDLSGELNYRPCLLYHIGRCGAPCAGLQDAGSYGQLIDEVVLFLEGRHAQLIPMMRAKMEQAAAALAFEDAARLRDQIAVLEKVTEKQKVVSDSAVDEDVLGIARHTGEACVQIFFVRNGKLVGREHFFLDAPPDTEDVEILSAFIEQYYSDASVVPRHVIVPLELPEAEVLERWLGGLRGRRVHLLVPKRGEKRRLLEMVQENAALVLKERQAHAERKSRELEQGLLDLQEALRLPFLPRRIECYDISNIQGTDAVGSMVVLQDGQPEPASYRRFKIKHVEGPNDFAMLQEVLHRRFTRGLKEQAELAALPESERAEQMEKAKFARLPDLVVIDGGKGQLSAAMETLRALDLEELPIVSLAEQFEEIFLPNEPDPVRLSRHAKSLQLMQTIRDEAHRFGLTYHRHLRGKRAQRSTLDDIPGIGPKRKRALIRHFGSIKAVREASLEALQQVPGIPADVAVRVYELLH